jgi:hypothetical protein
MDIGQSRFVLIIKEVYSLEPTARGLGASPNVIEGARKKQALPLRSAQRQDDAWFLFHVLWWAGGPCTIQDHAAFAFRLLGWAAAAKKALNGSRGQARRKGTSALKARPLRD